MKFYIYAIINLEYKIMELKIKLNEGWLNLLELIFIHNIAYNNFYKFYNRGRVSINPDDRIFAVHTSE